MDPEPQNNRNKKSFLSVPEDQGSITQERKEGGLERGSRKRGWGGDLDFVHMILISWSSSV